MDSTAKAITTKHLSPSLLCTILRSAFRKSRASVTTAPLHNELPRSERRQENVTALGLGFSYRYLNDGFPMLLWLKNMYTPAGLFAYEPLLPGEIRLVHVIAFADIRVECELRHFDTQSAQNWTALSYVWGDATANHKIYLNGKTFYIRQNLLGALRAFHANRKQITEKAWIWVDALCVNQEDTAEKSIQLPHMHRIYSQANVVTIWLGDDRTCPQSIVEAFHILWSVDDLSRNIDMTLTISSLRDHLEAFKAELKRLEIGLEHFEKLELFDNHIDLLEKRYGITIQQLDAFQRLYDHMEAVCNSEHTKLELEVAEPAWARFNHKNELFPPHHHFWEALLAFTSNPWHTRVWTFQELWLAKSKAILSSDGRLLPWDFIYQYLPILVYPGCHFEYMMTEHMDTMQCRSAPFDDFYSALKQTGDMSVDHPGSLAGLLMESHNRRAALAKDHVYGLLAMINDEARSKIKIDYSESDASVFANAFKLAIGPTFGDASALATLWQTCNPQVPRIEDGWPSWCPDFGDKQISDYADPAPYPGEVDDDTVVTWRKYAKVDVEHRKDTLGFRAWRLDDVKRCVPTSTNTSYLHVLRDVEFSSLCSYSIQDLFDLCLGMEQREWLRGLKSVFTSLDGCIASSVVEFIHIPCLQAGWRGDLNLFSMALAVFCTIDKQAIFSVSEVQRLLSKVSCDPHQTLRGLLLVLLIILVAQERKFIFETESGRFGFAWRRLSPGDTIVYVPGGHCQFVVSANGRRFLGPCYVKGYEGNSLMSILPEDEKDWEMFYVS